MAKYRDNTPANSQQQQQPQPASQQQQQQQQAGRPVPRLIMRTCFFDDAALAAVGRPAARAAAAFAPLLAFMQQHGLSGCKQVVLLGSGMDTRPWRLSLAPGVAWFEVDRRDVLAAKQAELRRAGAAFAPTAAAGGGAAASSKSGKSSKGNSCRFELQAARWGCASVDLQVPGWVQQLLAAGLKPDEPIVWMAEGLMYYLLPATVGPMLQEVASVSCPGSVIVVNFMTAEGLGLLHKLRAQPGQEAAAAAGAAATAPPADAAHGGSRSVSSSPGQDMPAAAAAASAGAAGDAAAAAGGAGTAASSSSKPAGRPSGLMSQFKFGVPDNCEEYFAQHGWRLLVRRSWTQTAEAYGWTPQVAAHAVSRSSSQEVQFAVGVVGKPVGGLLLN